MFAFLGVALLDVSCFLVDSKEDEIYPSFSFTFTLLHPFSSANTSTDVFTGKLAKISDEVFASFLTLILLEFTYNVLMTVCCTGASTSGSATTGFVSSFWIFSFLIHPLVVLASTHTQPFTISMTFISSSFFTSMVSVALITGTIFNFVSSAILFFPNLISFSSVSVFCSASLLLFSSLGCSASSCFSTVSWFEVVAFGSTSPFTVIKS